MLLKFTFLLQKFIFTLLKCLTSLQKFPSQVTKVPYTGCYGSSLWSLQKFLFMLPKCLTSLQKFPSQVIKVPHVTKVMLWMLQKFPKMLLKCPVLVTKVPFPLALSLSTVPYEQGSANITAKCHRSMRKSELPHQLHLIVVVDSKAISGKCSCVAGLGGYCNHMIGRLYYLAHCKRGGAFQENEKLEIKKSKVFWSRNHGLRLTTTDI